MANPSDLTRKEQVFARLSRNPGQWVDGPDLANEEVGGSEGLKRLRELRLEGTAVEMRKHPNPDRDIWQYRLIPAAAVVEPTKARPAPSMRGLRFDQVRICTRCQGRKYILDTISKEHRRQECPRCQGVGVIQI